MFSSGPNYSKLKTHLRLAVNRLKLLEKKKAELTQKARKEIADYISAGKPERARIRVEHIIREDFLVEAMEIVEMYCDLLLARFGLITQMKELDDGIAEAIASVIWVAPRLQADVQELKIISDVLTVKYGKPFAEAARSAAGGHKISEKLMHKMAIQAPSKLLVEKYLIEIAKIYNIEYEPDPQVMQDDKRDTGLDHFLIDLSDKNNLNGGGGSGTGAPQVGFIGYPQPPPLPEMPAPPMHKPFNYPPPGGFGGQPGGFSGPGGYGGPTSGYGGPTSGYGGPTSGYGGPSGSGGSASAPIPFNYNIPPQPIQYEKKDLNINSDFLQEEMNSLPPAYSSLSPDDNLQKHNKPKPQPRSKFTPDLEKPPSNVDFPDLPNVPCGDFPEDHKPNNEDTDEIDFDLIAKRFADLKKMK